MDITEEVRKLIGEPEGHRLEYKAVLPPSRTIAQLISGFANSEGGYILLGIVADGKVPRVVGLSEDFHANAIVHKAIDLLAPRPNVYYQYLTHENKSVYAIKVEKSDKSVLAEGKLFVRKGNQTTQQDTEQKAYKKTGYSRIKMFAGKLQALREKGTSSKSKFIDHYVSVLNLADDLGKILYPESPETITSNSEGKVLQRILYASCADNFETYLSDLLYEIYLANPNSLKSKQQVTIEEVLSCSDMQEFVNYWAKKKLSKLQRGSVKAFVAENKQINDLNVLSDSDQEEIEKALQIRHLYTHQNGRVDEKFLQYFPGGLSLNDEHQMTIQELFDKLEFFANTVDRLDTAAVQKYNLSTLN